MKLPKAKIDSSPSKLYKLPENFYERVLDFERQIESQKENCSESLIKGMTNLYSDAIEFHAS